MNVNTKNLTSPVNPDTFRVFCNSSVSSPDQQKLLLVVTKVPATYRQWYFYLICHSKLKGL